MSEFGPQVTWIDEIERLPNTCITCGMFTDRLVKTRAKQHHQKMVPASESNSMQALGCLLHLLGPLGLIIDAILRHGANGNKTIEKTVVSKSRVRVPCCPLCASQSLPEPEESDIAGGKYAFQTHPRFKERLRVIRQQTAEETQPDE
ncbi:MAG: hypothetical protein P8J33_13950 [Pirellulaceae bacterium]|nr:hypothetical protein [Pirellulaceae bacterium]